MIEIENLSFAYDEKQIINGFSACFEKGERVCIKGESGKGKTTFLRLICGLEKPQNGRIDLFEVEKIGMVFQSDVLLPWKTAFENVKAVSDMETAEKWLGAFSLGDSMNKYPFELSGGMCRRVALARAVAFEPDVLILDEAFKGLDLALKTDIMGLIREHFSDRIVIFTSHDEAEVESFASRTVEL